MIFSWKTSEISKTCLCHAFNSLKYREKLGIQYWILHFNVKHDWSMFTWFYMKKWRARYKEQLCGNKESFHSQSLSNFRFKFRNVQPRTQFVRGGLKHFQVRTHQIAFGSFHYHNMREITTETWLTLISIKKAIKHIQHLYRGFIKFSLHKYFVFYQR